MQSVVDCELEFLTEEMLLQMGNCIYIWRCNEIMRDWNCANEALIV